MILSDRIPVLRIFEAFEWSSKLDKALGLIKKDTDSLSTLYYDHCSKEERSLLDERFPDVVRQIQKEEKQ